MRTADLNTRDGTAGGVASHPFAEEPHMNELSPDVWQPRNPESDAAHDYEGVVGTIWRDAYDEAFADAMTGSAAVFAVWMSEGRTYDNEQELRLFADVGRALRMPGLSLADLGRVVMRSIASIAHDYAVSEADEAAERAGERGIEIDPCTSDAA